MRRIHSVCAVLLFCAAVASVVSAALDGKKELLMAWLMVLFLLLMWFGFASVFLEVWSAFRDQKRSIATAIAITCIVLAVSTVFAAGYLKEAQQASALQQGLETVGIVLMFGGGISGAIGLVWDRRIAKQRVPSSAANNRGKNMHDTDGAEPNAPADRPCE